MLVLIFIQKKGPEEIIEGFYYSNGSPRMMPKRAAAIYIVNLNKAKMVLRKGATMYEFFHEYVHLRHSRDLGIKEYLSLGGRNTIGEFIKEQVVFDKIIEHKNLFTRKEIKQALGYINDVRFKHGKQDIILDFDLSEIPDIRKEIKLQDLINKKIF